MTAGAAVQPTDDLRQGSIPWVNSIFEQPWWLDAVAPGQWGESVVRRGGTVRGRLPYHLQVRFGLRLIVQPPLTQTLGPWTDLPPGKYARQLEQQKKILTDLIVGLPAFDIFEMSFSPSLTNWLPFYWSGFQATTRYTYRITDLSDLDRVYDGFQEPIRRSLRKARHAVEVHREFPLDELIELNSRTFRRRRVPLPYDDETVRRVDAACAARDARRVFAAVDGAGRTHAVLYTVWDERMFYPLLNARNPDVDDVGANALLYWEAIRFASQVSPAFDFEGSMLEPIEHFIRAFGGKQTPYFTIWKTSRRAKIPLAVARMKRTLGRLSYRNASSAFS